MAGRVFGLPDYIAVVVVAMVGMVAGLGVVSTQSTTAPTLAPSDGPSPAMEDARCFRPLSSVIWGFLVTLLACSVAFWGRHKYRNLAKRDKIATTSVAVFVPIHDLHNYIQTSFSSALLIWKYQQSRQPLQCLSKCHQLRELWSWLSPFSKFPVRILIRCHVVVYVEKESPLLEVDWLWRKNKHVEVESEALVIGEVAVGKTKDGDYERKELKPVGKVALMLAEALPDYDELKFLRGNSGFAMIAIAMQALGYITAVIFREVKDLPVAPLEVVGLILNIMLLIEISVYSFLNPCHRPLVIFTNSKREEKLLEALATIRESFALRYSVSKDGWVSMVSTIVESVVDLCLCGIVIYFIVTLVQVSNIFVVLPLIFFVIATIIVTIHWATWTIFGYSQFFVTIVNSLTIPLNIIVYTWAFVVTIVYWKPQHFDVRAEPFNISQLIPFIG